MKFIVYAAGPIAHTDYAGATGWREDLQNQFDTICPGWIVVASPMRGKEYFSEVKGEIGAYYDTEGNKARPSNIYSNAYKQAASGPRGIIARDFYDCNRADLVFVNFLGAQKISAGTIMEIAWAYQSRIPVVCCMENSNVYRHPMIDEACDFVLDDFKTAIQIAANILIPRV
jgi:hypothetical protein